MSHKIRVCYSYHSDPVLRRTKMPVLSDAEHQELETVARKFDCQEMGFVEDLFLLLKSNGRALMSRANAKKNIEPLTKEGVKYTEAYAKVTRQHNFFRKLRGLPYFHKLASLANVYEAVERLMAIFVKMYQKSQVAKCEACPMKAQCTFGKGIKDKNTHLADHMGEIQTPSAKTPVADGCKTPPDAEMVTKALAMMMILAMLADKIQGAFLGKPGDAIMLVAGLSKQTGLPKEFDATFTGEQTIELLERLVNDLTVKQLAVFELARTFNQTLLPGGEEDKDDADYVAHDMRPRDMATYEEISKALPGELVEEEIFLKKVVDGNLQVRQEMERVKKKQYFHVLLDVSGSMTEPVSPNVYALHTKGSFASALCLSVLKKVSMEQGTLLFRFFAGTADKLRVCKDVDDFADLARQIGISGFNGGSTRIYAALDSAVDDIRKQEKDGMGKSEILLITDAEDSKLRQEDLKSMFKDIVFHVLDVSPLTRGAEGADALKGAAKTYLHVDPNNINFEEVAKKSVGKNGGKK